MGQVIHFSWVIIFGLLVGNVLFGELDMGFLERRGKNWVGAILELKLGHLSGLGR